MTDSDDEVQLVKRTLSVPICSQGITDNDTLMQHQRDKLSYWNKEKFLKENERNKNGPRKSEREESVINSPCQGNLPADLAPPPLSENTVAGTTQPHIFQSIDECIQHWCGDPKAEIVDGTEKDQSKEYLDKHK